jgi:hypothetical protein
LFIFARIVAASFRASAAFAAQLPVSPVAENITAATSIRGFA